MGSFPIKKVFVANFQLKMTIFIMTRHPDLGPPNPQGSPDQPGPPDAPESGG